MLVKKHLYNKKPTVYNVFKAYIKEGLIKTAKNKQNFKKSIDLKVALKLMLTAKVNHTYRACGN